MEDFLIKLGSIAGIGGIALGVFLYLFKKIKLPKGTRNHLTLFMWLVWSICILSIIIYFLQDFNFETKISKEIPSWEKRIGVTYPDDGEFIEFLEQNQSLTIHINSVIDFSLSSEESFLIHEKVLLHNDFNSLEDEELLLMSNSSLELPLDGLNYSKMLKLELLNNRNLIMSTGGTGIVQFNLRGYFNISLLSYSGATVLYLLTEVPSIIQNQN